MSSPLRRCFVILPATLLAIALLLTSPTASAQGVCFGPDGLNGPCCTAVLHNLPPFPAITTGGLGVCWTFCIPGITQDIEVSWDTPIEVKCAEYTATLSVLHPSGVPIMKGTLVLDYTRTWDEVAPDGTTHQVWRFAAKADLSFDAGGAVLCPLPPCLPPLGPHPTAFFYGYVDYVCSDPGTPFNAVLVLYHACDKFIHRPGFSDRPGSFHPVDSYGIVAPHSTVQPFTPANMFAPGSPLVGEATRDMGPLTPPPPPFVCITEDPVVSGDMLRLATGCVCNLSGASVHHTLRRFRGQTACTNAVGTPGGWTTVAVNFPVNPWFHLVTSSIGFWSTPGMYPGNERAWVDEGIFIHQSACTGDWADIKYGGTTQFGWAPQFPVPVPLNRFTDLADNYSVSLNGTVVPPVLGSIRPTDRLIYVNYP